MYVTDGRNGLASSEQRSQPLADRLKDSLAGAFLGNVQMRQGGRSEADGIQVTLTKSYLDTAKQLDAAARAKEKSKAVTAHSKLTKMCSACHKVHKGN